MNFIERVMRVMTHINVGAALGLAAWVLWSGWHIVTGQIATADRVAEVRALMHVAHVAELAPMHLVSMLAETTALPPCHVAAPAQPPVAPGLTGADL